MDQNPAQPTDIQDSGLPSDLPPQPVSPIKRFLPFILAGIFILILLLVTLTLFSSSSKTKKVAVSPTPRPTATPFAPPPTLPMATHPVATNSATFTPVKTGRLVFIKNGDIYNSDLASISLFIKNATPAADRLTWSPMGNLLAWRPVSSTATPSALTVFTRSSKSSITISPGSIPESEVLDYAWSHDEKQIAILYHDQSYHIDLLDRNASSSAHLLPLLNRASFIKQIFWPNSRLIVFSGEDGIGSIDLTSPVPKLIVDNPSVQKMKLSPDKKKILYSVGSDKKSDLFIINIDGTGAISLPVTPRKIDMGTTNLPDTTLNNGFLPYALWFPKGDKLMVGYHYLPNLPLVGIYDLTNNSFTALSTIPIYENDFMVDDLRLAGARINITSGIPSWQVSFFTIEDNAKLSTIRVIPDASSPSFFGDDLLPSGNLF
ncbi:hypothetical protein HY029_05585 [Candidatus Gottesmanbacteria bacterium]|nr:hypothetical protein [Candidatus Gottesmanbacteria bacterium]